MLKTSLLALVPVLFVTASAATLTDNYDLLSSLNDTQGGPALVSDGGLLSSGVGYSFNANQGLNLSSALTNPGDYSILMDFSFSALTGFRKILDFQNRTSDGGLYDLSTALNFFPVGTGPGVFSPDVLARVVLTRDSGTNTVTGYVNGSQQITFNDSGSAAVFGGTNNIIRFFEDDFPTGQNEASGGLATQIQIYNGALTSGDVRALGGPGEIPGPGSGVPEPAALTLVGFGLLSLGLVRCLKA